MGFTLGEIVTDGTNGGTSLTATFASAPSENDIIVIHVNKNTDDATTFTVPSGFTKASEGGGSPSETHEYLVCYKVAGASEGTTYTISWSNSDFAGLHACYWTPDTGTPSIDNSGVEQFNDDETNTYEDVLGITVSADALVLIFGGNDTNSAAIEFNSVDNGFTGNYFQAASGYNTVLAYKEGVGAGSTGTTRIGWEANASEHPYFFSLSFVDGGAAPAGVFKGLTLLGVG